MNTLMVKAKVKTKERIKDVIRKMENDTTYDPIKITTGDYKIKKNVDEKLEARLKL